MQTSARVVGNAIAAVLTVSLLAGCGSGTPSSPVVRPQARPGSPVTTPRQALVVARRVFGDPHFVVYYPPYVTPDHRVPGYVELFASNLNGDLFVETHPEGFREVLEVFQPPYETPRVKIQNLHLDSMIATNTNLFATKATLHGATRLAIYDLPLTPASRPKISVKTPDYFPVLALDSHKNIWITGNGASTIVKVTPPYDASDASSIDIPATATHRIAVNSRGDVFLVTDGRIYEFSPPYRQAPRVIAHGFYAILDEADTLYVSNLTAPSVDIYAYPYISKTQSIKDPQLACPDEIRLDNQHNLIAGQFCAGTVKGEWKVFKFVSFAPPYTSPPTVVVPHDLGGFVLSPPTSQ